MSGNPTFYPDAVLRLISTNFTPNGMSENILGFVPHVVVGNGSQYGWFNNPTTQASSHLWLSKHGDFEQYVSFHDRAWAQVAGNRRWISCECEGFPNEPYTQEQIDGLARLITWLQEEFNIPWTITDSPNVPGIGTHKMGGAAWGGHECPGTIRANQRGTIIARAYQLINGGTAVASADQQVTELENMVPGLNPSDAAHVWADTHNQTNALLNGAGTGSVRWTDANSQLRAISVLKAVEQARTDVLTGVDDAKREILAAVAATVSEGIDMDVLARHIALELLRALIAPDVT